MDAKHGKDWAIWEFRAEGTGYPDEAVDGRVRHYPWPDHHPPPFRLVPMIMASMRNWLHGGDLDDALHSPPSSSLAVADENAEKQTPSVSKTSRHDKRVVVVHCKAGKGRSGTVSCSYLISEEGWTVQDALARFTERRMRPKFGPGVSIPSQLRWVSYVDRWTKHGKKYVDGPIEIVEIHVWGLRSGVKVDVEGFIEDGKKIRVFHTFTKKERMVVEAGVPPETGLSEMFWDLAGYSASGAGSGDKVPEEVELADEANDAVDANAENKDGAGVATTGGGGSGEDGSETSEKKRHKLVRKGTGLIQKVQSGVGNGIEKAKSKTSGSNSTLASDASLTKAEDDAEPGGLAVIFKPVEPIRLPNSDVNIAVERRNKTHKSLNLTMVSAVAHVWFNTFFEGQGPEQDGRASDSGIFTIEWDAMDGIKGSSRKGSRAFDKMSVVWRVADNGDRKGEEIIEPAEGQPVPQVAAADWKGAGVEEEKGERKLGLRAQTQASADVSRASSLRSVERSNDGGNGNGNGGLEDGAVLEGVRSSGPGGEELVAEKNEGDGKKV